MLTNFMIFGMLTILMLLIVWFGYSALPHDEAHTGGASAVQYLTQCDSILRDNECRIAELLILRDSLMWELATRDSIYARATRHHITPLVKTMQWTDDLARRDREREQRHKAQD